MDLFKSAPPSFPLSTSLLRSPPLCSEKTTGEGASPVDKRLRCFALSHNVHFRWLGYVTAIATCAVGLQMQPSTHELSRYMVWLALPAVMETQEIAEEAFSPLERLGIFHQLVFEILYHDIVAATPALPTPHSPQCAHTRAHT